MPPPSGLGDRFHPDNGGDGTWLSVVPSIEPHSAAGERLVKDIRAINAPFKFTVAGTSAVLVDTKQSVLDVLPWTLGLIALATFVLLFLMTGSLLVPDQGVAAQRPEPHRDLRRDGVDLPGGALLRSAGLHADGDHRRVHADPHVLHRVRALDGLRGLPPVAHQGGVRPQPGQRARGAGRAPEDRADRHRRRAAPHDRLRRGSRPRRSRSSSSSASASRWPCSWTRS